MNLNYKLCEKQSQGIQENIFSFCFLLKMKINKVWQLIMYNFLPHKSQGEDNEGNYTKLNVSLHKCAPLANIKFKNLERAC